MIKRIDHIAIAVRDIEQASRFYTEHLGLPLERIEEIPSQKVRVAFITIGESHIELVEPLSDDSPISKFLEKRGEGLHHICLETSALAQTLTKLHDAGVAMLDKTPRQGAHDTRIAFVHPKSNSGVLTELAQLPTPAPKMPAPDTPLKPGDIALMKLFFEAAYKPHSQWKIGVEYEVGVVRREDLSPINFFGPRDVEAIFLAFREKYGILCSKWEAGFCFGIELPYGELSLEPGAQLEFASKPTADLAELEDVFNRYTQDLKEIGEQLQLAFYTAGVDPFHPQSAMPWSHRQRYKTMRSYLSQQGKFAHRMMQQTMSIQFNIDYADETDAVQKYQAARALQPVLLFLSSNSQIYEGTALNAPMRGEIWLHTDPDRCGLPPSITGFEDYIQYALKIPMFLIEREGKMLPIANGLTFEQYLEQGFEGHTARFADWALHLSTLFPEVRFKRNALELRMFDGNKPDFALALAALTKGIFFFEQNLHTVLSRKWAATWADAEALLALARTTLTAQDAAYLAPLEGCIQRQERPGDAALSVLKEAKGALPALLTHLQIAT